MILTVTPNPTIDRVLFVRNFAMQDVVRAEREVISPSGKGLDVSLLLHEMGIDTHAICLRAGRHGDFLRELVAAHNLSVDWVAAEGETRMATLLTDLAIGRQSTILAPTLRAHADQLNELLVCIDAWSQGAYGLVSAGSLPPGLPADSHAQIIDCATEHGLITLLDSSGPSLLHGVQAFPDILKVNAAEFAALMAAHLVLPHADKQDYTSNGIEKNGAEKNGPEKNGADAHLQDELFAQMPPETDTAFLDVDPEASDFAQHGHEDVVRLAEQVTPYLGLFAQEAIVVTLGRNGILAVTDEGIYHAPALPVPVVSPAGAGDAVSAGLMLARSRDEDWAVALMWASAMAAAVVGNAGTSECSRAQVMALLEEATVIELDSV